MAENAGVDVHGTLWVLNEMVDSGVLAPAKAAAGLRQMMAGDRRLPEAECRQRLREWEQR